MKPFTLIGAILLLVVCAAHVWRAYTGLSVGMGDEMVPMYISYVAAAVTGIVGLGMLMELRK